MDKHLNLQKELLGHYILTILLQKDTNGAELYKEIKPRMDIEVSTLYDVLRNLEDTGMIIGRNEGPGGKKRRMYTITNRGYSHQVSYAQVFENKLALYRQECAKDRFWPGFATGIFFPIWFPFFLIALALVFVFSVVFIAVAFALPGAATVGFCYFGVKLFLAAFSTYMAQGIVPMILACLAAVVLCALSGFWAWVTVRFVKFAARVSKGAFRRLFKMLSRAKK